MVRRVYGARREALNARRKHIKREAFYLSMAVENELAKRKGALQKIADNYGACHCDHSDGNCCEKVGEFCPHCIAEVALAQAVPRCPISLEEQLRDFVASYAELNHVPIPARAKYDKYVEGATDFADWLERKLAPPAGSTPRCPKCGRDVGLENYVQIGCDGGHDFECQEMAELAQFFQPASQPSPVYSKRGITITSPPITEAESKHAQELKRKKDAQPSPGGERK